MGSLQCFVYLIGVQISSGQNQTINVDSNGTDSEIPSCEDLDDWCRHEPKCTHEDVLKSCPKLCGTCEVTPPCEDLEDWCNYEPECDNEDVRQRCPKLCETCTSIFVRATCDNSNYNYDKITSIDEDSKIIYSPEYPNYPKKSIRA